MFGSGFEKVAVSSKFIGDRIAGHQAGLLDRFSKLTPEQKRSIEARSGDWYNRFSKDKKDLSSLEQHGNKFQRKAVQNKIVSDYKKTHQALLPKKIPSVSAPAAVAAVKSKFPTKALLNVGFVAAAGGMTGYYLQQMSAQKQKQMKAKKALAPVGQPEAQLENNHVVPAHLARDPAYSLLMQP